MIKQRGDVYKADLLIVDDTPVNLRLLNQLLTAEGYKVRPVTSGALALIAARSNPPDLIMLDIVMPEMDGYAVAAELKHDGRTRDIPIIFVSALGDVENIVSAFDAGGVDYVLKPFRAEEVLARVSTHLKVRELQLSLETANAQLSERNRELQLKNEELQQALDTIKTLSGLVPICAWCGNKIQDEQGNWVEVEKYIASHTDVEFTHGICPSCVGKLKKR